MSFYGNPNVTITAIDTSGGITCSRTSGQTPCFIQVSASAITATGTSLPYRDLEYSWNFGDIAGTEIFNNRGTGSVPVNANSHQRGPEAEYCYRSAGIYTVTLAIRGKNGSGFTTATVTQSITVTAYSASGGTFFFDSINGNDLNDGLSDAAPKQSISAINSAMGANRKLRLKNGSNWAGSTGITIAFSAAPLRIDTYGTASDPAPIVNITTGSNLALLMLRGGSSVIDSSDIVVSGPLTLKRSGDASERIVAVVVSDANCTLKNFYLDHVDQISDVTVSTGSHLWMSYENTVHDATKFAQFGIWGGSFTPTASDQSQGTAFFEGADEWSSFVGFTVSGAGHNGTLDHHLYPNVQNHCLYRYIDFGDGPTRNYCINNNWTTISGGIEEAKYHLISDCYFSGTRLAWDGGPSSGNPDLTQFKDFVVQFCNFTGLSGDGCYQAPSSIGTTFRYSNIWDCDAGRFWVSAGTAALSQHHVYGINVYRAGSSIEDIFDLTALAWTLPQTFTDNVVYDTRPTAKLIALDSFSNEQSVGTIIDRNQYWIPNDSDSKSWYDFATAKTFAQWQGFGFDVNGSVADPKWNNPAIGDFSVYVGFSSGLAAPRTPNTQSQFGLRHVGYLSGGAPDYQLSVRSIQSSYATAIYYGDPVVKLASTQYIAPALGNQTAMMGVFQGCMYWPKVGSMPVWSRFWPGGPQRTDATAYIADAQTALFLSAALLTAVPSSAIGQNIGFALGSTPSTTGPGYSTYVVDQSTLTTSSSEPFQVYAIYQGVGNGSDQASNYNWVVVCFNNERFRTQTGNA